jgi:hypothetical protein
LGIFFSPIYASLICSRNCRRQKEVERTLLEEETTKRVEQAIRKQVEDSLNSEEIKHEIQRRIDEGRKRIHGEVAAQIEKEKVSALVEAQQKAVSSLLLACFLLACTVYPWHDCSVLVAVLLQKPCHNSIKLMFAGCLSVATGT